MTFLRIKKIKGKEYVYSVENEWHKRTSRQKVKGYMGRAYRFPQAQNPKFLEFLKADDLPKYIESTEKNKILKDLVEWELFKFGINKSEFTIDLEQKEIKKNKKNVVLLINDGYMCNSTIKNLLEFELLDEQTDGYRFARACVEAGLNVPQDVFIALFGKIVK